MSTLRSFQVGGVDGCKGGWFVVVAAAIHESSRPHANRLLKPKRFFVAGTFAEVLSETAQCELVCVDIPIGLGDGQKPRQCDIAARRLLGRPRASSVFPAPIRPCLSAKDYQAATRVCLEQSGKKLNRQSFALLDKIRQVDDLITPALQNRIREIHPEVSFWVLNGKKPVQQNKKTVPGQARRQKLLRTVLTDVDSILTRAPTRGYAMDDALDALVAAWTAGETVFGKVKTLPENPERDSKGLRMEILCPAP